MIDPRPRSSALQRGARWTASLPAHGLLGLIWLYRHTLSPLLPALFGSGGGCRFYPTCSEYAAEAVRTHGAALGTGLAVRRLCKCHPFHPGGFDPVPPRPVARRATAARPAPPAAFLPASGRRGEAH